jgi:hypothetical protein
MLTYRSDIGIPGYTGYTPGWATVPVPINGSNQHTGEAAARQQQRLQQQLSPNLWQTTGGNTVAWCLA